MALAVCRISRRCRHLKVCNYTSLSNTLKGSTAQIEILLNENGSASIQQFLRHLHINKRPVFPSLSMSGIHYRLYNTEDATKVIHPENNQRSVSLNQQDITIPCTEIYLEDLEDEPPLSPLEEITENEAVQIAADLPIPPASFTLQDYVDQSETLKQLVLLGVDLSKVEKRPNVGNLLLRLDFERDVSKILLFLKDVGLEDNQLGSFLTKNPFILSGDLENLHKRVAYLSSKKFSKHEIARMVAHAPYLLNFSVERLDNRLGFFQKELGLSAEKTRDLVVRLPRMITSSLEPIKENLKVFQIELGFKKNEIQHMATKVPKMITTNKKKLTETFDYVHNKMEIPHHLIVKCPQVFNTKLMRLKERHLFLTFLGRAAYDPTLPNYVSLEKLSSMPDDVFCGEVAKATVLEFDQFLKTL
ncbi:transcription termination factor 3, mitochondrial [Bombina bombina]|uniref:transcription termination factor 3, mitochondrial n=1 Tax=Bombina bombina TaxID=8345 RepID=UPI00235AF599|nr:transcription termination factor 3, mitochondrial [Bombina bombina]